MMQLALPLAWPEDERGAGFIVSDANRVAVTHLERWATWPVMATILAGPRKSGRSLLARTFAGRVRGATLVDDAERADEESLFHAWNAAQERRRPLLIVADEPVAGWTPALPDLASRLAATPRILIAEPDEALAAQLIEKLLGLRGLSVPPAVVAYLARRMDRSYVAITRMVDALDAAALFRRQGLTVPLARRVLADAGVIDSSRRTG